MNSIFQVQNREFELCLKSECVKSGLILDMWHKIQPKVGSVITFQIVIDSCSNSIKILYLSLMFVRQKSTSPLVIPKCGET